MKTTPPPKLERNEPEEKPYYTTEASDDYEASYTSEASEECSEPENNDVQDIPVSNDYEEEGMFFIQSLWLSSNSFSLRREIRFLIYDRDNLDRFAG